MALYCQMCATVKEKGSQLAEGQRCPLCRTAVLTSGHGGRRATGETAFVSILNGRSISAGTLHEFSAHAARTTTDKAQGGAS